MTEKNEQSYYQFPLVALAYGSNHKQRLQTIVSWCCLTAGQGVYRMTPNRKELKKYAMQKPTNEWPAGTLLNNARHLEYLAGMRVLGVIKGDMSADINEADTLQAFIDSMERAHGKAPHVRIRNDLFWDAVKGQMPYRHFAVLTAVYAAIGAKKFPVRITRRRIRAGMLGYKSAGMLTDEALSKRPDKETVELLTERQIRTVLDHLEDTSLFARVQTSPRCVYFSNRMQADAMRAHLADWIGKRNTKAAVNRKADRDAMQKARAIKADITRTPSSGNDHAMSTTCP